MTIKIEKQANDLNSGIKNMIDAMCQDYNEWCKRHFEKDKIGEEISIDFRKKYSESFEIKEGKKYIKVIGDKSVKAFIVKEDGYYKKGTVLKAASWNLPAKHSRGNVLDGNYHVTWHGPLYLK